MRKAGTEGREKDHDGDGAAQPRHARKSVGTVLAEARQAAGLSVQQLSARSCVRETLIEAIEKDDFSPCGGDFYARGHVRNLAAILGLDAEALVHEFDELHGGVPLPVRAASVFQVERPIKIRDRRSPNWSMAMGVALAVIVVFGVVKTMGGAGDTTTAEMQASSIPPPSSSPSMALAPEQPRQATALAAGSRGDTVVLEVKAERSSRLHIRDAKGRRLFAGTLKAGKTSVWKAKTGVRVTFGDAGAVSLQVNGKDVGSPGRSGQRVQRYYKASAKTG
ncbi:helix-turn-helix domain-containing protein [Planobispora takensis]|uniref:Membrane protein n=1 Tax=Planobispora takensis TaxID=1367882 RepID=A0A8J3WQM9_9ACTN|nr:helix-turn-helix domain-containing protein [Planobispora takensis]GIH98673.1 membrane protein [Planobispora takensis]